MLTKLLNPQTSELPTQERALAGRDTPMALSDTHFVFKNRPLKPPFPSDTASILLGMGCFWGAERRMWEQEGVYTTAVGYAGGLSPNPTYEEVCSGMTGHTEVVLVVYNDSDEVLERLFQVFWESHDPTQGMRQGADVGTQYRSAIYTGNTAQKAIAERSLQLYQAALNKSGFGSISTEIKQEQTLYYAEDYHQQYLAKNPGGYCGIGGTGVCY